MTVRYGDGWEDAKETRREIRSSISFASCHNLSLVLSSALCYRQQTWNSNATHNSVSHDVTLPHFKPTHNKREKTRDHRWEWKYWLISHVNPDTTLPAQSFDPEHHRRIFLLFLLDVHGYDDAGDYRNPNHDGDWKGRTFLPYNWAKSHITRKIDGNYQ